MSAACCCLFVYLSILPVTDLWGRSRSASFFARPPEYRTPCGYSLLALTSTTSCQVQIRTPIACSWATGQGGSPSSVPQCGIHLTPPQICSPEPRRFRRCHAMYHTDSPTSGTPAHWRSAWHSLMVCCGVNMAVAQSYPRGTWSSGAQHVQNCLFPHLSKVSLRIRPLCDASNDVHR